MSPGARSTVRSRSPRSRDSSAACSRICVARSCSSRIAGRAPIRRTVCRSAIVTERAWHSLFARHMLHPRDRRGEAPRPRAGVHRSSTVPNFTADPSIDQTNSETFILLNFAKRRVLIGGTNYAGEIKKSIFTVMNYLLPLRDVMPMHCSANIGAERRRRVVLRPVGHWKDDAVERCPIGELIGDDEHGWSAKGVFNFEGGCYAKMIRLSAEAEPQIYTTTRRFGTVLENVTCDPVTRGLDLNDDSVTRRTRAAPIRCRSSTTPCRPARVATRRTSSCSPLTHSACYRRLRGSRPRRRCTTSCRATRRRSPAPSAA